MFCKYSETSLFVPKKSVCCIVSVIEWWLRLVTSNASFRALDTSMRYFLVSIFWRPFSSFSLFNLCGSFNNEKYGTFSISMFWLIFLEEYNCFCISSSDELYTLFLLIDYFGGGRNLSFLRQKICWC